MPCATISRRETPRDEGVATGGFERRSGMSGSARNIPDHPQNNFEKIENFKFGKFCPGFSASQILNNENITTFLSCGVKVLLIYPGLRGTTFWNFFCVL